MYQLPKLYGETKEIFSRTLANVNSREKEDLLNFIWRAERLPGKIYDWDAGDILIKKHVCAFQDLFIFSEYNFTRNDKILMAEAFEANNKEYILENIRNIRISTNCEDDIYSIICKNVIAMSKYYNEKYIVSVSRSHINEYWKDKREEVKTVFERMTTDAVKNYIQQWMFVEERKRGEMTLGVAALNYLLSSMRFELDCQYGDKSGLSISSVETDEKSNFIIDTDLLFENKYYTNVLNITYQTDLIYEKDWCNSKFLKLSEELLSIAQGLDFNIIIYSSKELTDDLLPEQLDLCVIKNEIISMVKDGSIGMIAQKTKRTFEEIVIECMQEFIRKKISRSAALQIKIVVSKTESMIVSNNKRLVKISNPEENVLNQDDGEEDYYCDETWSRRQLAEYYGYQGDGSIDDFLDDL